MTTKLYAPIPDVIAFTLAGNGPFVAKLNVFAALDPSPDYPAARVSISSKAIGALSLTAEQAAQLEDRLTEAREDEDEAEDAAPPLAFRYLVDDPKVPLAVYDLSNGRCGCCCEPIAQGAAALAYWESGERVVLLHAERCPEPALWFVELTTPEHGTWFLRDWGNAVVMLPMEAAIGRGRQWASAWPEPVRIRIIRFVRRSTCTALTDRPVSDGVECTYRKEPCGRAAVDGRCERHQEVSNG